MDPINVILLVGHTILTTISAMALYTTIVVNRKTSEKRAEMEKQVDEFKEAHNAFAGTQETIAKQIEDLKTQVSLQWRNTRT